MLDSSLKRAALIHYLEGALALADEIDDADTGYLVERALDAARARQVGEVDVRPLEPRE